MRDAVPVGLVERGRDLGVAVDLEALPDLGVLALVGGDRGDLGRRALALVQLLLVAFEGLDQLGDRLGPEQRGRSG